MTNIFLDACARLPIAVLGVGVLTQGKKKRVDLTLHTRLWGERGEMVGEGKR